MYYQIEIIETGTNKPGNEYNTFNCIIEQCQNIEQIREYLTERYGKIPGGRNKIYTKDQDGNSIEVGFLHSFWNADISHNSKTWFQQDRITITKHQEPKYVTLKKIRKNLKKSCFFQKNYYF